MSPASSGGALEVEHYIGACLISSTQRGRHKQGALNHYNNHCNNTQNYRVQRCNSSPSSIDGWAGGVPLISLGTLNQRWRHSENTRQDTHHHHNHPLVRLAVHTQGAPLILTNRYNHRKNRHTRNPGAHKSNDAPTDRKKFDENFTHGTDTVSVASDESSSSSSINSDNSLPRIIKPRKRRKKDRKPVPTSLARPSVVVVSRENSFTDGTDPDSPTSVGTGSFVPFFPYDFLPSSAPLEADFRETSDSPNLHHSFDDVEDYAGRDLGESTCQCRYCDPSGLIWDIDRDCYSPFLTMPGSPTSIGNLANSLSSLSLEEEKGVVRSGPRVSRDLEVSTEIVTSLNGHRDIEIKFFSAVTEIVGTGNVNE